MSIELFESFLAETSDTSMEELNEFDNLSFIKLKMLQFKSDIEGELEDSAIIDLLEGIKARNDISKQEYAIRSLELKKYYQKFSLELFFSDKYEIDFAIYLKLTGYYYLRINELDKAMGYLSESLALLIKNGVCSSKRNFL